MPRHSVLSPAERNTLLALPDNYDDLIRFYTFSEKDLSIILKHRGEANRLGFAIQLCYMRYPGIVLRADEFPSPSLLHFVAKQLKIKADAWKNYGQQQLLFFGIRFIWNGQFRH